MVTKRILVLSGNPKQSSFSGQLAHSYAEAASKHHDIRFHNIAEMNFDANLHEGYQRNISLEPDLIEFQQSIQWANHLVITTPIWWGALPAKFKGVFDRTFLPGFAFKYEEGKTLPNKLLTGKSARIVMTMDTPTWYYRHFQGAPALKQLKITTLQFCGFNKVRNNMFGPIIGANSAKREQWLATMTRLGRQGS